MRKRFILTLLTAALSLPVLVSASDADQQKSEKAVSKPPSSQDIAKAKSEGLVWSTADSHVYYKNGDSYGKTKHGRFMTEDEAKKMGMHKAEPTTSPKASGKKTPDQSGIDATIETHSSTPPTR
jgi:hypothetical protein